MTDSAGSSLQCLFSQCFSSIEPWQREPPATYTDLNGYCSPGHKPRQTLNLWGGMQLKSIWFTASPFVIPLVSGKSKEPFWNLCLISVMHHTLYFFFFFLISMRYSTCKLIIFVVVTTSVRVQLFFSVLF